MKSPNKLDETAWADFEGGESASLVIKMLYGDVAEFDDNEAAEHCDAIFNVGTVYPVTIPAIPHLVHAALHSPQRSWALGLLAALTDRTDYARRLETDVRSAVAAEARSLLPCLTDPDSELRRLTLRVLGGCATLLHAAGGEIETAVLEVFDHDPDAQARADALTALELLEDEATFVSRIEQAVSAPDLVVRRVGMLCALEVGYMAGTSRWAELAADDDALHDELDVRECFPIVGTRSDRLARVLGA